MGVCQVITLSFLLSLLSPLTGLVAGSAVTVDPSLSSLLNGNGLPAPHPELGVAVSRELAGAGFHRKLLTRVERVTSSSGLTVAADFSEVQLALVENVTSDMYIDVDQVSRVCVCVCVIVCIVCVCVCEWVMCIVIVYALNVHAYVSFLVTQVAFLAEFGGPDLIASSHMDTEKPASLSSSHIVMTFTRAG